LIVNLNELPSLLRDDLRGHHHWLKLKLRAQNRIAMRSGLARSFTLARSVSLIEVEAGLAKWSQEKFKAVAGGIVPSL